MDLKAIIASLLSDKNVKAVAKKAGLSNEQVAQVMAAAIPALLKGANAQADTKETSESFYKAVKEHAEKDPKDVDEEEGEKIVKHLLGSSESTATKAIAKKTGLTTDQVITILAALAPYIMNLLGLETGKSESSDSTAELLGALLGGSSDSKASNDAITSALSSVLTGALSSGKTGKNDSTTSILEGALSSLLTGKTGKTGSNSKNDKTAELAGEVIGSVLSSALSGKSGSHSSKKDSDDTSSALLDGLMGLLK